MCAIEAGGQGARQKGEASLKQDKAIMVQYAVTGDQSASFPSVLTAFVWPTMKTRNITGPHRLNSYSPSLSKLHAW